MEPLADALRYVNIALLVALTAVAVLQWRRYGGAPARWVALTFAALAGFFGLAAVTDRLADGALLSWLDKLLVALALLFPYFLYRFTASFRRQPRGLEALALGLTAIVIAWSLALPELPAGDAARPLSVELFIVAGLVQWTVLSLLVAALLWRAGRGHSTVPRYRMRILSIASVLMNSAIVLVGAGPGDRLPSLDLAFRLLVFASVTLFFIAFAPPAWLREAWRQPEVEKLRRAVSDLMGAATAEEVKAAVASRMAEIVGARAVAFVDDEGAVVASHGATQEMLTAVESAASGDGTAGPEGRASDVVRLPVRGGTIVVWTSPYAPFFGTEEFELLRSLAAFMQLALDRARLFEHEREARVALERADELKSKFVALASHELRTPVAVIYGVASTLHLRGDDLNADQRQQLLRTLFEQTERLRRLVDQLLDLSRLEANAIPIRPERFRVRSRLEELVPTVVGERMGDVQIDVPPELDTVADPDAFDRVVSNLVTNALRYGDPPVVVTARQSDSHFRLAVEDRGRGVAADFVPALFDRFTRSEDSEKTPGGTGLGLSIAQSYAEAHGGRLVYEDADPHGARFELVLPVDAAAR